MPIEPDELALEESDVVNVFKKLEDGKILSQLSIEWHHPMDMLNYEYLTSAGISMFMKVCTHKKM